MEGDDIAHVLFRITDTGVGIPDEKRILLFRPFSQLDDASSRLYGGTGLGLAITGQLVTMMKGRIDIESEPRVRTAFTIHLPLPIDPSSKGKLQPVRVTPVDRGRMAALHVLIAEDNDVNLKIAELLLRRLGVTRIETARNGRETVDRALANSFDLILMDCQMPDLDGYEATRHLRESGCRTTIIALTASAMESDREACLAAGMDDFLAKPVLVEDLSARLSKWFPPA
jgi:CheY-like chemotaxis protein